MASSASRSAQKAARVTPAMRLLVAAPDAAAAGRAPPSVSVGELAGALIAELAGFSPRWNAPKDVPKAVGTARSASEVDRRRARALQDPSQFVGEAQARQLFGESALEPRAQLIRLEAAQGEVRYPIALLQLERRVRARLVQALSHLDDPWAKVEFLTRRHGALGGRTVVEAVQAGLEDKVLELARSYEPQ